MEEFKEIGSSQVVINKLQTTIDGGARITLDLDSQQSKLISSLLQKKLEGKEMIFCVFMEGIDER